MWSSTGLQYFIKEYLAGEVVTDNTIAEADAFISRYMADVRVAGPGVDHEVGYDCTMFPQGDWASMVSGDYDATGVANPNVKGKLPIRIEALPEGTLLTPGVCCFKITNTHPRFFWLPNFLETILVQVWQHTETKTHTNVHCASLFCQSGVQCLLRSWLKVVALLVAGRFEGAFVCLKLYSFFFGFQLPKTKKLPLPSRKT